MGGPRVLLRAPRPGDRAEDLSLNRRSRTFYGPWATPPTTPRAFATPMARKRRPDAARFLICRRSDGAILRAVELSQIARGTFRSAYFGFPIGARRRARGA